MKSKVGIFFLLSSLSAMAQVTVFEGTTPKNMSMEQASSSYDGKVYKYEYECSGYCDHDKEADNMIVGYGKGSSQNNNIAKDKAQLQCRTDFAKQCHDSSPNKILPDGLDKNIKPLSCDWLDGKKLIGTATHNSISCKSTVCSGEVVCTGEGRKHPTTHFIICEAEDGKCPQNATKCFKGNQVKELQKSNFDVKYGPKVGGAVGE